MASVSKYGQVGDLYLVTAETAAQNDSASFTQVMPVPATCHIHRICVERSAGNTNWQLDIRNTSEGVAAKKANTLFSPPVFNDTGTNPAATATFKLENVTTRHTVPSGANDLSAATQIAAEITGFGYPYISAEGTNPGQTDGMWFDFILTGGDGSNGHKFFISVLFSTNSWG